MERRKKKKSVYRHSRVFTELRDDQVIQEAETVTPQQKTMHLFLHLYSVWRYSGRLTLWTSLRKYIRRCHRPGGQEGMPQNKAMLEQQQLARTSKYSPKSCKGHQEIPKLIAAACNTCLKTVWIMIRKKKSKYDSRFKNHYKGIRGMTEQSPICALSRQVDNTNRISECMSICNVLEG